MTTVELPAENLRSPPLKPPDGASPLAARWARIEALLDRVGDRVAKFALVCVGCVVEIRDTQFRPSTSTFSTAPPRHQKTTRIVSGRRSSEALTKAASLRRAD